MIPYRLRYDTSSSLLSTLPFSPILQSSSPHGIHGMGSRFIDNPGQKSRRKSMHIWRICFSNVMGRTPFGLCLWREYNLIRAAMEPAAGADKTSSTRSEGNCFKISDIPFRRSSRIENRFAFACLSPFDGYTVPFVTRWLEQKPFAVLAIPAHFGPIPRATLTGSCNGLPHFLQRASTRPPEKPAPGHYRALA